MTGTETGPAVPVEVVVVFPGAGGSSGMFNEVRQRLRGVADVVVPDTPGRGRRTRSPVPSVPALASELSTELSDRLSGRRWAVFAACFGTLIAFELLRERRRRGSGMPAGLVVCGRAAPDRAGGLDAFAGWSDQEVDGFLRESLPAGYDWQRMPADLRDLVRHRVRKDIELGAAYEYRDEAPLEVPIHAWHGEADPYTSLDDLRSWRVHSTAEFAVHTVPGGNYFYLEDPATVGAAVAGVAGS